MEGGGGDCRRPESTTTEWEEDEHSDVEDYYDDDSERDGGVIRACVIRGSKHRDGSIYRQDTHWMHRLYRLNETSETPLMPSNLSYLDTTTCHPDWTNCTRHTGCAMMQIFSLKLVNHSTTTVPAAPIQLYGFMAVRDLLHPLRNYVFQRTRDDPLVIHHPHSDDPSSSSPLLIQIDGRSGASTCRPIKRPGQAEQDDLELIDGAATFSELTPFHGVYTQRIRGSCNSSVDISLALLRHAVEARIELSIPKLPAHGISFSAACSVSKLPEKIQLFDGVVDEAGGHLSFVVAVVTRTPLLLNFKAKQLVGGSGSVQHEQRGFPARAHGCNYCWLQFDFGEIDMKRSKSLEPFNKMEEHNNGPTASDDSATVRPPSSAAPAQCSTVSVFLAKINGAPRLVTAVWNKTLINQSFTITIADAGGGDDEAAGGPAVTHKVELKPWPFWSKKGGKALDVGGDRVDVFWDLRSAKFAGSSSPEPAAGYYVALVSNEEVVLLLGDGKKDAYKRTKSRPSLEDAVLVCRRESVLGRRCFGARARLDARRSKEHEIAVEISLGAVPKDPEMWVTVDGVVLMHVKNLQWKFRGNDTVLVDQAPVQVIWDVHNWVFNGPGSHAAFVFKPGAPPEIEENDGRNGIQDEGADFCFFLQAWRME
ncbi:hypothetical protein EJB05_24709 [Eragrostis curvula]|uniref:DUF6598 domain-containing protein n=1 Tax=Eragrostis curvula TaxID=38414 RepID=A0A5J9VBX6_9POAL|nr:hypothetical protein EJB05_24709 [Eragrostis curvula]